MIYFTFPGACKEELPQSKRSLLQQGSISCDRNSKFCKKKFVDAVDSVV